MEELEGAIIYRHGPSVVLHAVTSDSCIVSCCSCIHYVLNDLGPNGNEYNCAIICCRLRVHALNCLRTMDVSPSHDIHA